MLLIFKFWIFLVKLFIPYRVRVNKFYKPLNLTKDRFFEKFKKLILTKNYPTNSVWTIFNKPKKWSILFSKINFLLEKYPQKKFHFIYSIKNLFSSNLFQKNNQILKIKLKEKNKIFILKFLRKILIYLLKKILSNLLTKKLFSFLLQKLFLSKFNRQIKTKLNFTFW